MRLPRTARKAVRVKGKKGKAGHDGRSSMANPASHYRKALTSRLSGVQSNATTINSSLEQGEMSSSGLTREALSQFDSDQREKMMDEMSLCLETICDEDEQSAAGGALTFRSIASNLTQCSNPAFERVLRAWSGNSQQQNSVLAVLAGLTQVIKEKGGSGTNVEYFALLLKASETFTDSSECENIAATVFLLKLIVGRVPTAVLRMEFSRATRSLVRLLSDTKSPDSHDATLVKSTLACLGVFLRAQEWSNWSSASTRAVFHVLLRFVVDPRARVRKTAHLSIVAVLRSAEGNGRPHPASSDAVRALLPLITAAPEPGESPRRALWALSLLGGVLPLVSGSAVQEACERALLPLMAQPGQAMVRLHAIRALHGLFAGFPSEERLSAEKNGKLLTALYNVQPPKNCEDIGTMKAWMTTARAGLYNLLRLSRPRLVAPHLSRLFPMLVEVFSSPVPGMAAVAAHAAVRLLDDVVRELLTQTEANSDAAQMAGLLGVKETAHLLLQLLASCRSALKFQFVSAWPQVLRLMAGLVGVWGRVSTAADAEGGKAAAFWAKVEADGFGEALRVCVRQLAGMRDERVETKRRRDGGPEGGPGGEHIEADLERILGVVVQALGAQEFLRTVPLNMSREEEEDVNLKRSWVIPLLLSHGGSSKRPTSLKYFFEHLSPLGDKFHKQMREAEAELVDVDRPGARVRLLETLYTQVWALLPVFCTRPVELTKETFISVGGKKTPTMVQALQAILKRLSERPELRRTVIIAIRRLVAFERRLNDEEGSEAPRLMGRYAKNVLPALFNVYVDTVDSADGTAVIDAVREYVPLVESSLIQRWYSNARDKVKDEMSEKKRRAELDLLVTLAPYLPEADLEKALFEDCVGVIRDEEQTLAGQKKAYRMLQVLAESPAETARRLVGERVGELMQVLAECRRVSQESSMKPRLRTIAALLDRLQERAWELGDQELQRTLKGLLAEVQLSMRVANSEARKTSRTLLTRLALCWHRTVRGRDEDDSDSLAETLTELQTFLTAGVDQLPPEDASEDAGHVALVTTDALLALLQSETFRPVAAAAHVRVLLRLCAERLVSSSQRELARAGVKAITETVAVSGQDALPLDAVMAALERVKEKHRKALRFDVKELLLKVMKRAGVPLILEIIPEYLRFPFVQIARTELRGRRRKLDLRKAEKERKEKEEAESDEEMEVEMTQAGMLPKRRQPQTLDHLLDNSEEEEEEKKGKEAPRRAKRKRGEEGLWLEEAPGDVLDLLATDVAGKIHTKAPVAAAASGEAKKKKEEFPVAPDGRMLICDSEDGSDSGTEEEEEEPVAVASVGKGAKQVRPWRQKQQTKKQLEPGEQFRSAKAKGDMKRGGGPDPYAFLKLRGVAKKDINVLMKKKKSKSVLGRKKKQ